MNVLFLILIIFLIGAIVTAFAGKISGLVQDGLFVIATVIPAVLFFTQVEMNQFFDWSRGGVHLKLGITPFSYFFAILVLLLGVASAIYSVGFMKGKPRKSYYYFNYLLTIMAMLGILFSRDFISFFVFWEIMTWASYLMVVMNGTRTQEIGIKYFVFSAIGAYAMLMAMVLIHSHTGNFLIQDFIDAYPSIAHGRQILIAILLLVGFSVKAALMPLHVWAPGSYAYSPMSFTSVFSGALSKMGIYGMVIVFVTLLSHLPEGTLIRDVIAWMGAITAVISTLWAIAQDDARKLLAYSSVGQLGYIVIAVAIGTPMAMLSGLFMVFMHGLFKGALFMVVGAVEKQTGTTDFTQVTGLIRKMPWTFLTAMISIIALAGIPPLGGFIGKWMLYESLIISDHYLLVIVVFFSSTAAFLYSYKFLFGFFLGQEEEEWAHVKEAPMTMLIPMLALSVGSVILGVFPQLILKPINNGLVSLGFSDTYGKLWESSVLFNEWGDKVVLQPIMYAIMGVFLITLAFTYFRNRKRTRYVSTKDISTSGEIPLPHENLTFKENFFQPFLRAVEPVMKKQIDWYYKEFGAGLESIFNFTRRIYSGNGQTYALYAVIFLIVLLLLNGNLFGQ